jgi:hypothetical protein
MLIYKGRPWEIVVEKEKEKFPTCLFNDFRETLSFFVVALS